MTKFTSGKDFLTFLNNHYLNHEDGRALITNSIKDTDPTIHDAIMGQLDVHNLIMQKLNASQAPSIPSSPQQSATQMALGDEQPLIPNSEQVHIPNVPQQPTQQLPPGLADALIKKS